MLKFPEDKEGYQLFIYLVYGFCCVVAVAYWAGKDLNDSFKAPSRSLVENRVYITTGKTNDNNNGMSPLRLVRLPDDRIAESRQDGGSESVLRDPPPLSLL